MLRHILDQVDDLIIKKYRQILSSEVIDTLKHLLQTDSISSVPEIEVFRALSNARCVKSGIERVGENLQKMAGDLI